MSDKDRNVEHAAASSPPPTDTPSRGRGRGRGKGRGKRKSLAKTKALAAVKKLVPTGRRGRIKQYSDPRVQAAYERQREVKTAYLSIISHVKPALEELASRNIEKLKKDSNAHKAVPEHDIVKNQLDAKLTEVTGHADKVLETQLGLIERSHEKNTEFQNMQYENGVEDAVERFYDAQLERLRLLEEMYEHSVPPDVRDNSYNYKKISEKEYEERGVYTAYRKDGIVVPYPSRVEGTDMYEKAQMMLAQYAPKPVLDAGTKVKRERDLRTAAIRGRLSGVRRKALTQPDSQPGAKRPTTRSAARAGNDDDDVDAGDLASYSEEPVNAPARHIMGILAAAVDNDGASESAAATPRASPDPDEEDKADDSSGTALDPRLRSPEPPRGQAEFDEYGVAPVQRGSKANNRIAVRPGFQFDDIDIGFKDSTNDGSRIKNPSSRGKYLNTPNTNAFYYDPLLWNYDVRCQSEDDLDQDLVKKYRLHPRYGFFIEGSINIQELPGPICEDPKPVVLITPSGMTLYASRSHGTTSIAKSATDYFIRKTMESVMKELVDKNEGLKLPTAKSDGEKEVPEKYAGPSLGLLHHEDTEEAQLSPEEESEDELSLEPTTEVDDGIERPNSLSALVNAAIFASAEDSTARSTRAKSVSRPYDAIRDVFGTSAPTQPAPEPQPFNLTVLAEMCNWEPRPPQSQQAEDSNIATRPTGPIDTMAQQPSFDEPLYTASRTRSGHQLHHEASGYGAGRHNQFVQTGPVRPMDIDQSNQAMAMEEETYIDPRLRGPNQPPPPQHPFEQSPMSHHQAPISYSTPQQPMGLHNPMITPALTGSMQGQPPPAEPLHYGAPRRVPPPQPSYSASSPQLRPSTTGLPPLRPPRQIGHPQVFHTGPPTVPHPSVASTNAGPFYSPGLPGPYHNTFPPPPQEQHGSMGMPGSGAPMQPYYGPSGSPANYPPAQPPYQHLAQGPNTPQITSPPAASPRSRPSFQGSPPGPPQQQAAANNKYRKLEPAPIPPHRIGWANEPQLRTVRYEPSEDIKDYSAVEPLPGRGPTFIRGWNVNNSAKKRARPGREDKDGSG
ncbi:hypothetical protein jhhlp_001226 [Lomentospora prolificans]|uniref:Uncharacterized protein n=1 Tax=Lomentospora prolificans TaxID=41688 RepID=A0A2N3NHQ5_9PEZI|nr:hypothetical protein jhhlp_001226 [Lomentospora prolificans]